MSKVKKKFTIFLLSVIASISALCLSGCNAQTGAEELRLKDFFGAPVTLVFSTGHGVAERDKLVLDINEKLDEIQNALSAENPDGDIYKFNAQSGIRRQTISFVTSEALALAAKFYEETDGAFDPAVYRLTDLWGFTARHAAKTFKKVFNYDRERTENGAFGLPDEKYISAFRSLTGFNVALYLTEDFSSFIAAGGCDDVQIDGSSYNMQIDLSALAKGYAADAIKKIIDASSITGTYISFGGSSLYLADKADDFWGLGIVNPVKSAYRGTFAKIDVKNKFVATSGTYENYYVLDGKIYHHIIDPATGRPSESDLISVTLVGDGGAETDALATAMVVFGKDKAIAYLKDKDYGYVLVTEDKKVYTNIESFTLRDDGFEVVGG